MKDFIAALERLNGRHLMLLLGMITFNTVGYTIWAARPEPMEITEYTGNTQQDFHLSDGRVMRVTLAYEDMRSVQQYMMTHTFVDVLRDQGVGLRQAGAQMVTIDNDTAQLLLANPETAKLLRQFLGG